MLVFLEKRHVLGREGRMERHSTLRRKSCTEERMAGWHVPEGVGQNLGGRESRANVAAEAEKVLHVMMVWSL